MSNIPPKPQPTLKDVLIVINIVKENQEKDHKLLVETRDELRKLETKLDTVIKVNHLKTK